EEDVAGEAAETVSVKKEEKEIDWEAYLESCYERPLGGTNFAEESEESSLEATLTRTITLTEHLMWQMHLSPFTLEETLAGEFIIGNIDEDGYLRVGENNRDEKLYLKSVTDEIVKATGAVKEVVESALKKIQQFDPAGVGSRTLKECLLIQAEFLECNNHVIKEIINNHLNNLEKKNYKAIAVALKIPIDKVVEALKVIMGLSPRPGSAYGQSETNIIIPDIYIQKTGGDYVVLLNENGLPRLKISSYYKELIRNNGRGADATKAYIQERLRSAKWLIQSIHQRQRTIYKVAQSIIKFQRDFLDNGVCCLKPLILRDVAADIGMHESTVSRVTTNKYAHTPHGIFELKYFFSAGIERDDGTGMAFTSIMEKLKNICEMEDASRPLSDQKITDLLKKSGINIARRTVTKYREAMDILPANGRKRLF
ncbi:MAG: RNA polymerase factor sigma-54, partial [Deltaproteobacteria bacterium]|nr:RNA polymerase factor sigma-54 [Deltaproteobacteria bacterium]